MLPLRCRLLAALTLALLPLVACGEEATSTAVPAGEVVLARNPAGFADAPTSSLTVPAGRLEMRVGEPIAQLSSEQTRDLISVEGPPDGSFVPVAWRLDGTALEDYSTVLGPPKALDAALVTDQGRYQLPAPVDGVGNDVDIFYVAIEGRGAKLELELTYDAVVQTVDLRTGKRDRGVAKGLYDLPKSSTKIFTCPTSNWVSDPAAVATIECNLGKPIVLPYVDGTWAEPGQTFVTVPVGTTLTRYLKTTPTGGAADYEVVSSEERSSLPGARLVDTLGLTQNAGAFAGALVFATDGRVPDTIRLEREYRLNLVRQGGGIDVPERMTVTIGGSVDLPK